MNYEQIRELTKRLREEKGLTQAQLSELAKVSVEQISKMENGDLNISIHAVGRVFNALGNPATLVLANEESEVMRLPLF